MKQDLVIIHTKINRITRERLNIVARYNGVDQSALVNMAISNLLHKKANKDIPLDK
jgi:hypothetical protein